MTQPFCSRYVSKELRARTQKDIGTGMFMALLFTRKVETTKVSVNRGTDKQSVVYLHTMNIIQPLKGYKLRLISM